VIAIAIPLVARAETTQSDLVLVREEEVVDEDLMAAGNSIQVDGTIMGDLIAAAFERVVVNGVVEGDVLVISGRVEINGEVGGSVRALAGSVVIDGEIVDDLAMAFWETELSGGSRVGRDVLAFGRSGSLAGRVGRDVRGRFSRLSLGATVDGSVEVSVGNLTVGSGAQVEGDIAYRSREDAVIEAADPGEVIHRTPLRPNIRVAALRFLTFALVGLLLLAGGLLAAHYWPQRLEVASAAASRPGPAWLAGVGVLFSPLFVIGLYGLLLALSPAPAAVPLGVVFLPIALGLFGLVILGGLTGAIPVAAALGRRLRNSISLPAAVVLGLAVLAVLVTVPILRWLVLLVAVPVGLGSWLARPKAT
jgi:cytoskeletal protein CcmA (bactofilin family)